jgi:hypothetical protein
MTEARIEITPEMLEAGILEYSSREQRGESREETIARIYRAMRSVEIADVHVIRTKSAGLGESDIFPVDE